MSIDMDIKAYVLFAPTSPDYADNFNRWNRTSADAARRSRPSTACPKITPRSAAASPSGPWFDQVSAPVLLFHGTGDTNTPYAWSVRTVDLLQRRGQEYHLRLAARRKSPVQRPRLVAGGIGAQMLAFFDRLVKGQ